jgi:hypothetical protein
MKQPLLNNNNLYDGIKAGEAWAFDYLEKATFPSHLYELKGDKTVAFDMYQDVVVDLYIRMLEGTIEKREEDCTPILIAWIKRHLHWKRLDYWKSIDYKSIGKLEDLPEYLLQVEANAEEQLYYKQVIEVIDKMSTKCSSLLTDKLVHDLNWKAIYPKYPNENEGSLRVQFSKCLKALCDYLDE